MEKHYLTYEEFGAVGDGVTDDSAAIASCHAEANKIGVAVRARDGAKYYIGGKDISAIIKTDVNFGTAQFIIDDTHLENTESRVFVVASDYEGYELDLTKLLSKDEKIILPHEGEAFVRIYDENHKCYIRKGLNQNAGVPKSDIFIVNKDGRIETDLDWTYESATKCEARRLDERSITISGGIFTTIANQAESKYNYHYRGFEINRDRVTISGLTHYVIGEIDHGAPYDGFFWVSHCAEVTIKDCLLSPHRTYQTPSVQNPEKFVSMGSYDIILLATVRTSLINIKQTVDIMDTLYWGLMGSNFCKDMLLLNCEISRFDAHMGVTNATICGCKLGHQCLNLIGHGKFVLEDSYLLGKSLINLRQDYGSNWNGDIEIKNCVWQPISAKATLFNANNSGDHDFGFACFMPKNIRIDGLSVKDGEFDIKSEQLYLLPIYDRNYSENKPFKYTTPSYVSLSNVTTESGRKLLPYESEKLYEGLTIEYK